MACPKCNNPAASGSFCTLCGTSLLAAQPMAPTAYGAPAQPAPYAQPQSPYGQPFPQQYQQQQFPLVAVGPMGMVPWRCAACGYTGQSIIVQRISTAGWVTFGALLVFCLPLFWIGLLIKENRCQCPNCRVTY